MHASRLRVIIADDHPIIADGIQLRLEQSLMVEIVGIVTNFAAIFDMLATRPADILLLDITGMQGSAIATIHALRRDHPSLAIIKVYSDLEV